MREFTIAVPDEQLDDLTRPPAGDALARTRDRSGLGAGRAPRMDAGAGRVLDLRLRLARPRIATECLPATPGGDRRARHPCRSCPRRIRRDRGDPRHPDPRLAGIVRRVPERRRGTGEARVRCGGAVASGLRVQRQADRAGLGRRAGGRCLGRADGRARVRPLRRGGQRLGHERFGGDRSAASGCGEGPRAHPAARRARPRDRRRPHARRAGRRDGARRSARRRARRTRPCTRRDPRRSATRSPTRPSAWPPGSPRSSTRGATSRSRATTCSTP